MTSHSVVSAALLALAAALPLRAQDSGSAAAGHPLGPWLVAGTFPVDTGPARLTRAYLPEPTLAPRAGEAAGRWRWRVAEADDLGRIDFNRVFADGRPTEQAAAYAMTYVTSPAERTVSLAVETDDDGRLWLNGRLVYSREVARGVTRADTVTLRLSRGVNRLLYKVVNRSGGFGMGARLLDMGPDALAGLEASAARPPTEALSGPPSPWLTLGPVRLEGLPVLDVESGTLALPLVIPITRWGGMDGPVELQVGAGRVPVPGRVGLAPSDAVTMGASWTGLARQALRRGAAVVAVAGGREVAGAPVGLGSGDLLSLLSWPMEIRGWRRTADARARTARGAAWTPLPGHEPTEPGDTAAGAIGVAFAVPPALDGLTLELEAAEYGADASFVVNDRGVARDSLGRLPLCSRCAAGDGLDVVIRPGREVWWDPPRLRVRDAGWREVTEGARWARFFTDDSAYSTPSAAAADSALAAVLEAGRAQYRSLIARRLSALAPAIAAAKRDTLWAVGNSHIDAAWLWRWPETVDVVDATWGTATKLMRKYPEMQLAASSARYYDWLEERDPALLGRIRALAAAGRWHPVGGWWVEADANMPAGESFAHQALYGQQEYVRLFGAIARVAWIPDTFGYTWQLPQIFRQSGFESFVTQKLRWNDTNDWTADRNMFWWEGRDGTRILTYIPYGYDHDLEPERLAREWRATADSSAVPETLTLYGVGDHGGGPTMEMLDRRRSLARIPTFPPVVDASPDSVLARMRAAMPADAPIIRDELYLEYHRGVLTTQAETKRWNRRLEGLLGAAETAAATAALSYPRERLRDAWRLTLFNQFHDILPGSGIGPVYEDADSMYRVAEALASSVLDDAAQAIASPLDTRGPRSADRAFLVLNPTGRVRAGVAAIPLQARGRGPARGADADEAWAAEVVDERGSWLPSARVGDTIFVRVADVPATGGKLVFLRQGEEARNGEPVAEPFRWLRRMLRRPPAPKVLENAAMRVEIDPVTGEIASLVDRATGREMVAAGSRANVLMTQPDEPKQWDAWNIDSVDGPWTPVRGSVSVGPVMRDGLGKWVEVTRSGEGVRVRQRYVLPDMAKRLDMVTTVDWSASHRLLKAAFPWAVSPDSVWAEIPYGAMGRPAVPATREDSARYELSMQRWVDASRGGVGVALVNDGKYGYDVQGDTVRLTLLKAPKWPDPEADMGTHTFTYSVVPHPGDWRASEVLAAADELNRPMRAVAVTGHEGAGVRSGLLRLEGGTAVLSALKRAEADPAVLVVRLVEREGRTSTTRLVLPGRFEVREADLLERATGPARTAEDGIAVRLRPWEIRTLLVRRKPERRP